MKNQFYFILFLNLIFGLQTQIPYSFSNSLEKINPIILPEIKLDLLLEQENQDESNSPYKYGEKIAVNINPINSGKWVETSNGTRIWRVHIQSNNAFGIKPSFNNFFIPEGSELFIYSKDRSTVLGPFTHLDNHISNLFGTELIEGNNIIIEYIEPQNVLIEPQINLYEIVHAYKNLFNYMNENNNRCNNNVACADADPYEDQVNSVIFLDMGGYICSAALINNTSFDLTPYVLTAEHCVEPESPGDYNSFTFYFNHQSSTCNGNNGYYGHSKTGSQLKASRNLSYSDFALLEMNTAPNASWDPYYAGWSRSTSSPTISVGIHHPGGEPKKINYDNDAAYSCSWYSGNHHWCLTWDDGGTAGGSSGSPLFNNNKRIVGHLSGGTGGDCGGSDLYGKFSSAWNGSNSSQRLSDWLDPINSSETTIEGTYTAGGGAPELTLTAPNGGESILAGNNFQIQWEDDISENISLKLYKAGYFVENITTSTPSDGTYNWTTSLSLEEGSDYKIKITSTSNTSVYDYSDSYFTITEPLGEVQVYFGNINPNNNTIEIMVSNPDNISGYQFNIIDFPDYIDIVNASGGITEELGFLISTSSNGTVIAFSLTGEIISPGVSLLTNLEYSTNTNCNNCENTTICIDEPIFSNQQGLPYPVETGNCENINFTSMLSGDVNADGILNILDVVLLVGEVLNPGDFTDSQLASGDLNNDGLLNILDVVMLVNIILN